MGWIERRRRALRPALGGQECHRCWQARHRFSPVVAKRSGFLCGTMGRLRDLRSAPLRESQWLGSRPRLIGAPPSLTMEVIAARQASAVAQARTQGGRNLGVCLVGKKLISLSKTCSAKSSSEINATPTIAIAVQHVEQIPPEQGMLLQCCDPTSQHLRFPTTADTATDSSAALVSALGNA